MTIDWFDYCYATGDYTNEVCELCPHKDDCNGHEDNDDDED